MIQIVLRSLMKKAKTVGLICSRSSIPEDTEWEEAKELHQYYYNFLLLDEDGLMPLRQAASSWHLVDFPTFQHYYALYLLGVPPIPQYIQDKEDEKVQKQTD